MNYLPPLTRMNEEKGFKILAEDYWYFLERFGVWIKIFKGFTFGASVPRIARSFVSVNDLSDLGDMIHDLSYRCADNYWNGVYKGYINVYDETREKPISIKIDLTFDRKYADNLWYDINTYFNTPKRIRNLAFSFVSLFGWYAWNRNIRKNKRL